jgi:hypothetical protein
VAKRRKLTAKQIAAGFGGKRRKAAKKSHKRKSKPLTAKKRKALGYHKERTVAKKKKGGAKKRRGGSRRGGGILSGIDWMDMAGAGAYGWLERQVSKPPAGKSADDALLKKVPLFFEGIGYAGCSAILAHFIGKNLGGTVGKMARHYAKGTFDIAAYKLAKNGGLYTSKAEAEAALAGDEDMSGDDDIGYDLEGDDDISGDDDVGYGADGMAIGDDE